MMTWLAAFVGLSVGCGPLSEFRPTAKPAFQAVTFTLEPVVGFTTSQQIVRIPRSSLPADLPDAFEIASCNPCIAVGLARWSPNREELLVPLTIRFEGDSEGAFQAQLVYRQGENPPATLTYLKGELRSLVGRYPYWQVSPGKGSVEIENLASAVEDPRFVPLLSPGLRRGNDTTKGAIYHYDGSRRWYAMAMTEARTGIRRVATIQPMVQTSRGVHMDHQAGDVFTLPQGTIPKGARTVAFHVWPNDMTFEPIADEPAANGGKGATPHRFRIRYRDGTLRTMRESILEPIVDGETTRTLIHLVILGKGG